MALDEETKQFIVKAVDTLNESLIEQLNKNFNHVSNRFDDVDKRLSTIESKLHIVQKDTNIIPDIFGLLEKDGDDIAKLTKRIDGLEN